MTYDDLDELTKKNVELYGDLRAIAGLDAEKEMMIILVTEGVSAATGLAGPEIQAAIGEAVDQFRDVIKFTHRG